MDAAMIRSVLADALGLARVPHDFVVNDTISTGDNGAIYHATLGVPVAVKEVRDAKELEYYQQLARIDAQFGRDSEFAVPHIFTILPTDNLIVMEWVSGKPVSKRLVRPNLGEIQARSLLNRAGRWIARFHQMEEAPATRVRASERLEYLRDEATAASLREDSPMRQSIELLADTAAAAQAQEVPCGLVHGDFKPDNLLLSDGRTVGIDFQIIRGGILPSDLVQFINHLRLLCYEPAALRVGLWRRREALVAAFLEGYAREGCAVAPAPLAWLRLHHLASLACHQVRRGGSVRKWYLARCIERELARARQDLMSIPS